MPYIYTRLKEALSKADSVNCDRAVSENYVKGQIKDKVGLKSKKSLAIHTYMHVMNIRDSGIVLVSAMGAFMVKGSRDRSIFKETSSCPSTLRYYHFITAMLAIGMEIPNDKKFIL